MGEIAIKNMIKTIFELLVILLIPLIGLSSGLLTHIDIDDSVEFIVDTQSFTVEESMHFHTIIIDSDYIVFNTTGFHITTTKNLDINVDYLNENIWQANHNDLILTYDVTEPNSHTSEYTLSGFPPGTEYKIRRNGIHLCDEIADDSGNITFTTGKIGTHRFKLFQQGESQGNHPPNTPNNPIPPDGSNDITTDSNVYWSGGDIDGDQVTYDVYLGTTSSPPLVKQNHTNTIYNPTDLQYSTTYYWQIKAWDNHDESTIGSLWTFTTEDYVNYPPTQPKNLNPGNNAVDVDIDADLSWYCTDPEQETITYDIYFGRTTNPPLLIDNYPYSSYVLNTLSISTTYYWKIISHDSYGNTNQSPVWKFTTSEQTNTAPQQPTQPTGETISSCYTNLSFSTVATDPDNDDLFYVWSWDDESEPDSIGPYYSGESCSVMHQYHQPGTYQIRVKARDTHYRESDWSAPLNITIHNRPQVLCGGPYSGFVNDPIHFNATVNGGIPPFSYTWEFGDGSTETGSNPLHTYRQPGDYTVTVTVNDSKGFQASNTTVCHIATTGDLNVVISSMTKTKVYENIQFTSLVKKGQPPYEYHWEFGDGKKAFIQTPTHIYTRSGFYTINLTVKDTNGLTGSDSVTIQIINPRNDQYPPSFEITKPKTNSLYLNDNKILFWMGIFSIGDLTIELDGYDDSSGINYVEFYLNDELTYTDTTYPYEWAWTKRGFFRNIVTITMYDNTDKSSQQSILIWKLF